MLYCRLLRRNSGAALTEFALVVPFLFAALVLLVELVGLFYGYLALNSITYETARFMSSDGEIARCICAESNAACESSLPNPDPQANCDLTHAAARTWVLRLLGRVNRLQFNNVSVVSAKGSYSFLRQSNLIEPLPAGTDETVALVVSEVSGSIEGPLSLISLPLQAQAVLPSVSREN